MIWNLLLWGLLALMAAVLILLCTPLKVRAHINTAATPRTTIKLGLFGGMIPISLPNGSTGQAGKSSPTKSVSELKPRNKFQLPASPTRLISASMRLFPRLLACLKIEKLRADVEYGFSDPAETGIAYGLAMPFTRSLPCLRNADFVIRPNFSRRIVEADMDLVVRVTPITTVPSITAFGWSVFAAPKLRRLRS